ncbi:MAG: Flp pilus assembly protein CpaB [Candidatus Limnocylindria bacterium]
MELEYSDKNSRRSKVYIAVGLIIALLVAGTVFVALQASGLTGEREVASRTVVVAAREIAARKQIEEGDLTTRTVPIDPTNETAFSRLDEVVGRVAGTSVAAGQLLTRNVLASTTEGQPFSILEPGVEYDASMPDLRAVSVNVPDERAVAGTLQAGQRIDLIATLTVNPVIGEAGAEEAADNDLVAGPSTKTTLQALEILSRNGALYILRTDLGTAEQIAELIAAGAQFTLALRAEADDRVAETEGSTIDMLLEEFGFPAPEIADLEGR